MRNMCTIGMKIPLLLNETRFCSVRLSIDNYLLKMNDLSTHVFHEYSRIRYLIYIQNLKRSCTRYATLIYHYTYNFVSSTSQVYCIKHISYTYFTFLLSLIVSLFFQCLTRFKRLHTIIIYILMRE